MASVRGSRGLTEDLRARLAIWGWRSQASIGHRIHWNHCRPMRPLASILLGGVSARLQQLMKVLRGGIFQLEEDMSSLRLSATEPLTATHKYFEFTAKPSWSYLLHWAHTIFSTFWNMGSTWSQTRDPSAPPPRLLTRGGGGAQSHRHRTIRPSTPPRPLTAGQKELRNCYRRYCRAAVVVVPGPLNTSRNWRHQGSEVNWWSCIDSVQNGCRSAPT